MKVNIRGKENVKLSQEARGYITSKVEALEKLFNKSENLIANVLCKGYEKYTVVEITIPTKQGVERIKETKREVLKKYFNRLCLYNGETLTLRALTARFRRAGIKHPFAEARKYLVEQ